MNNLVGIIGIFVLLGIVMISNNRSKIDYKLIIMGIMLAMVFCFFILSTPVGRPIFSFSDKLSLKL